jgi:hypothetical protein
MSRTVAVVRDVLRVLGEILRTRNEIFKLVTGIAVPDTYVWCGDIYINCDSASCSIGDKNAESRLTLRYKSRDYAELEVGGKTIYTVNLRRTTSKTAKKLLTDSEKCADELEKRLRELETRLATLKQILTAITIIAGNTDKQKDFAP